MSVFYPSKDSVFQITNTSGQLKDISPYIISIDGLPGPRELVESTALGDSGKKWQPGLENVVITLELMWSDDDAVGADTVLGPLSRHTAATAFDYGPEGKANTDIKYYGNCWVRNYSIITRVGDIVKARAELQVDGALSARGAY